MNKELKEQELDTIAGGQMYVDNVMGVKGLNVCSGNPTENNPNGLFWKFNGISLTEEEAMNKLKKHSTRRLDETKTNEHFLLQHIYNYNDIVEGRATNPIFDDDDY